MICDMIRFVDHVDAASSQRFSEVLSGHRPHDACRLRRALRATNPISIFAAHHLQFNGRGHMPISIHQTPRGRILDHGVSAYVYLSLFLMKLTKSTSSTYGNEIGYLDLQASRTNS